MRRSRTSMIGLVLVTFLSSCAWADPRGDSAHTRYNPLGGLTAETVGSLTELWRVNDPSVYLPVMDHEFAYGTKIRTQNAGEQLQAFSADGSSGCDGIPRTCAPVWVATLSTDPFSGSGPHEPSWPVLAGRYIAVATISGRVWRIALYDRRGIDGCTGSSPRICTDLGYVDVLPETPFNSSGSLTAGDNALYFTSGLDNGVTTIIGAKLNDILGCNGPASCAPFMRATTNELTSAVAYSNGRIYARAAGGAAAFSGDGTTGCTSGICYPLWYYDFVGPPATLAVRDGRLFGVGSSISVFDANGRIGCTGIPRHCQPLWRTDSTSSAAGQLAVTNTQLIGYRSTAAGPEMASWDLTDTHDCGGSPTICAPQWLVKVPNTRGIVAAADNVGFVDSGLFGAPVIAFRLDGVGCDSVTRECPPIRTTIANTVVSIAHGRVTAQFAGSPAAVYTLQT